MTDEGSGVRPDVPGPKRAPLPPWWWEQSLLTRRVIAVVVLLLAIVAVYVVGDALLWAEDRVEYADAYEFVDELPPATLNTWDALAQCETNSQWAKNTGNGFYGGLQFTLDSWDTVGGEGLPSATPREEQIYRADKLRQLQGWVAWPNCAAQLGLT